MKRIILLITIICLLAVILPLPAAADASVTVTDAQSFVVALHDLSDGGTIKVAGTVSIPKDFKWPDLDKTVTITGDTLDLSALTDVILGNAVRFERITLKFTNGAALYANGNKLYIANNVTVIGKPTVYGGGHYTTVDSTDVTLLSGTYTDIFGGSYVGGVRGDVNLFISGRVNADLKSLSHKHTYCVYGGSYNGKVAGKVMLSFGGGAKANYIFGGSQGTNSQIDGGIEICFTGGKATSIYGGSRRAFLKCDVKLTMEGGTVEQVFGGCEHAPMTGNIEMNILRGTVTRRIYGGCYNEVSSNGTWSTKHYVNGDINLTLGSGVNITFSTGGADRAIYAHSRQKTLSDRENTHIYFADDTAYNKYKNKLCARDSIMQSIMSGVSAADVIHTPGNKTMESVTPSPSRWAILLLLPVFAGILLVLFLRKKKRSN